MNEEVRAKRLAGERIVNRVNSIQTLTDNYESYLKECKMGGDWERGEFMRALNNRATEINKNLKILGITK